jgi:hypothetical protein
VRTLRLPQCKSRVSRCLPFAAFADKLRQPDDKSATKVPSDPAARLEAFKKMFEAGVEETGRRINTDGLDGGYDPALYALLGHAPSRQVFIDTCYKIFDSVGPLAAHAVRGVLLSLHFGEAPALLDIQNVAAVPKKGKNTGIYGVIGTPFIDILHSLAAYTGLAGAAGNANQGGLVWRIWQDHLVRPSLVWS